MILYQKVSVEKELPKEGEICFVFTEQHDQSKGLRVFANGKFMDGVKYSTIAFLKEISIEQWMVEFAEWKDRNYRKMDQNAYVPLYSNEDFKGITNIKKFTYEELAAEFLKTKKYVQK